MNNLILVRHGDSTWNLSNKFAGWVDVPLSDFGMQEAFILAKRLGKIKFDVAFTSELQRAQTTLHIVLSAQKRTGIIIHEREKNNKWQINSNRFGEDDIPAYCNQALNERYYGLLQGMEKAEAVKRYGKKNVLAWRRTFDQTPPLGESLNDTYCRAVPYFKKRIIPEVKKGKKVLVSAHGNSLRAIMKHIEKIPDQDVPFLELPHAIPIVYNFEKGKLKRVSPYLNFDRPITWGN